MITLDRFIKNNLILPQIIFVTISVILCSTVCIFVLVDQEIKNKNLYSERVIEGLKNPILTGSYLEVKSRLMQYNDNQYCTDFDSPVFQTNLCKHNLNKNSFLQTANTKKINNNQFITLNYTWAPFFYKSLSILVLIISILATFAVFVFRKSKNLSKHLNLEIKNILDINIENNFSILEFSEIHKTHQDFTKKQNKLIQLESTNQLAKKVAHDIRSPLSALESVLDIITNFPEEERLIIKHAIERINDIANDLLIKGYKKNSKNLILEQKTMNLSNELIPALVNIIISEKRMEYKEYSGLTIQADLKDSFGLFAKIDSNELKRMLSNLINNSVESFKDNNGKITIKVQRKLNEVMISVADNGKGIPNSIINNLGSSQFSFGKENNAIAGSGLGLYHAKQTIEKFNGKLEIESKENQGTTIKITLPIASNPSWFLNQITLDNISTIISVDDDFSIHKIWKRKLPASIDLISLQSEKELNQKIEFLIHSNDQLNNYLFLIDFELLDQGLTGLELIQKYNIISRSILVTSQYDDPQIQKNAIELGVKIIPKNLAMDIPLKLTSQYLDYDLVHVEDDKILRLGWELKANKYGKKILSLNGPEEMRASIKNLNKDIPIYIDSDLGNGTIKGEYFSKELYDLGFKNIYLATGYSKNDFNEMPWIKDIVSKNFPSIT